MATRPNMRTLQMQWTIDNQKARMTEMQRSAEIVAKLLELGDGRLIASDGPAGGKLPDLSPEEWGAVYRSCVRIVRLSREPILASIRSTAFTTEAP